MPHPFGVSYAYGGDVPEILNARPGSAFSQGDPLVLDSSSSLSFMNILAPAGMEIIGVALSASTASYRNLVPYVLVKPETVFWSRCSTGMSDFTVGAEYDFERTTDGQFFVTNSQISVRVVIVKSAEDCTRDNSELSYVQVRFLAAGGETEWL